jgi:hypothetical protein
LAIGERLMEVRKWLPENSINFTARVIEPIEKAMADAASAGQTYSPSLGEQLALWIHSPVIGILAFVLLAYSLYHFARKPLESQ